MSDYPGLDAQTVSRLQSIHDEAIRQSNHSQADYPTDDDDMDFDSIVPAVILRQSNLEAFYDIGNDLGKGRFGVVKECRSKETGVYYAGKFVRRVGLRRVDEEDIKRELEILNAIRSGSRHLLRLRDGFETKDYVVYICDLITGGELFDYLSEKDVLMEDEAATFTRQILDGIACLHEKNIVHLDLKPENIMLKDNDRKEVVIIDLGVARDLTKGETKVMRGTPEFVAPEVLNYDPVSTATDMWTVGVIVYIMLSGYSPFLGEDDNETYRNIMSGDYDFDEEYFPETTSKAKDFINHLLRLRPKDRFSAEEALIHAWVRPRRGERSRSRIDTTRLRRFTARQKWQTTMEAVQLSLRYRLSLSSTASVMRSLSSTPDLGSPREETPGFRRPATAYSGDYSDNVFSPEDEKKGLSRGLENGLSSDSDAEETRGEERRRQVAKAKPSLTDQVNAVLAGRYPGQKSPRTSLFVSQEKRPTLRERARRIGVVSLSSSPIPELERANGLHLPSAAVDEKPEETLLPPPPLLVHSELPNYGDVDDSSTPRRVSNKRYSLSSCADDASPENQRRKVSRVSWNDESERVDSGPDGDVSEAALPASETEGDEERPAKPRRTIKKKIMKTIRITRKKKKERTPVVISNQGNGNSDAPFDFSQWKTENSPAAAAMSPAKGEKKKDNVLKRVRDGVKRRLRISSTSSLSSAAGDDEDEATSPTKGKGNFMERFFRKLSRRRSSVEMTDDSRKEDSEKVNEEEVEVKADEEIKPEEIIFEKKFEIGVVNINKEDENEIASAVEAKDEIDGNDAVDAVASSNEKKLLDVALESEEVAESMSRNDVDEVDAGEAEKKLSLSHDSNALEKEKEEENKEEPALAESLDNDVSSHKPQEIDTAENDQEKLNECIEKDEIEKTKEKVSRDDNKKISELSFRPAAAFQDARSSSVDFTVGSKERKKLASPLFVRDMRLPARMGLNSLSIAERIKSLERNSSKEKKSNRRSNTLATAPRDGSVANLRSQFLSRSGSSSEDEPENVETTAKSRGLRRGLSFDEKEEKSVRFRTNSLKKETSLPISSNNLKRLTLSQASSGYSSSDRDDETIPKKSSETSPSDAQLSIKLTSTKESPDQNVSAFKRQASTPEDAPVFTPERPPTESPLNSQRSPLGSVPVSSAFRNLKSSTESAGLGGVRLNHRVMTASETPPARISTLPASFRRDPPLPFYRSNSGASQLKVTLTSLRGKGLPPSFASQGDGQKTSLRKS